MLVHCLVLSSVASSSVVTSMGDRWAWGFTDWSLKADRKIDTGQLSIGDNITSHFTVIDETLDSFVPDDEDDVIREPRKVESESEPRNFIKDKLCAIGLADVS